jgi:hypothetical protein
MSVPKPLKPTLYISTFVSVPTPTSDLLIQHGALWVNAAGVIGGFEEGVEAADFVRIGQLVEKLGWKEGGYDVKILGSRKGGRGWVMPGFVGEFYSFCLCIMFLGE